MTRRGYEGMSPPIGEPQPGAPEGYWYGSAYQDVVDICRIAPFEAAVAFVKTRLADEYMQGVRDTLQIHAIGKGSPTPMGHGGPCAVLPVVEDVGPIQYAWACRVLDAWAIKTCNMVPAPRPVRGPSGRREDVIGWCIGLGGEGVGLAEAHDGVYPSPAAARVAAARLAVQRDPSLVGAA